MLVQVLFHYGQLLSGPFWARLLVMESVTGLDIISKTAYAKYGRFAITLHLKRGEVFVHKYGVMSVFIGRFVGPVRALVPLVAGMLGMKPLQFTIANVASAIGWAPAYMLPGILLGAASLELPPDIAMHVILALLLIVLFIILCVWFTYKFFQLVQNQIYYAQIKIWRAMKKSRYLSPITFALKHNDRNKKHGQLNLSIYFIITSLLFLCLAIYVKLNGATSIMVNAAAMLRRAVALAPHLAAAHSNLGLVLWKLGAVAEAEQHLDTAVTLDRTTHSYPGNLGVFLSAMGRWEEADDALARAVALAPAAELGPHWDRALLQLERGQWEAGFAGYETRIPRDKDRVARGEPPQYPAFPFPTWRGENLNGKTLWVRGEQGTGDRIMFAATSPT